MQAPRRYRIDNSFSLSPSLLTSNYPRAMQQSLRCHTHQGVHWQIFLNWIILYALLSFMGWKRGNPFHWAYLPLFSQDCSDQPHSCELTSILYSVMKSFRETYSHIVPFYHSLRMTSPQAERSICSASQKNEYVHLPALTACDHYHRDSRLENSQGG
jgi:hypothetical protein